MELPTRYDPREVEERLSRSWDELWKCDPHSERPAFSVVIPPPNITGRLHHGHALNNTLQDILTRYKRMDGFEACWFPGTDHAGIATQNVIERELAREGTDRHKLGREAFLKRVWEWKEKYGSEIVDQLKVLGCSCDWSRLRFTLDEGLSQAVRTAFIRLYQQGLVYRGDYMINWCPRCATALSDIEVEHKQVDGKLYHVRYPLEGGDHVTVATTRPETMLGDTGVAVNPADERYRDLIGRTAVLPVLGRRLPIVGAKEVDPSFGTGILKITPAHDPLDSEIGQRHELPSVNVLNKDGTINEEGGPFAGMDREAAREALLKRLQEEGLLEKVELYRHSVGHCGRCGVSVEPLISTQWFVHMQPLAEPAINAAEQGRVAFVPPRWAKVYTAWLEGIRDWCISRQLWWGHRIPAWYGPDDTVFVAMDDEAAHRQAREHYGKEVELRQDEDVLDTWFSSSLWPFSIMGWPELTPELERFYPTTVLVTAFDILFFWVARMVMMGLHFMGDVPFRQVFVNPLIVDAQGQKMSKSKGNSIDPLEVKDTHGMDALRFSLARSATKGQTLRLGMDDLGDARNFLNKVWNMARFILTNTEDLDRGAPAASLAWEDRWIRSRLERTVRKVREELERFNFHLAAEAVYHFTWHELCDWYLELAKLRLYGEDPKARATCQRVLQETLEELLELMHPFVPFISEEIWRYTGRERPLAHHSFPTSSENRVDEQAEARLELLQSVVVEIRALRAELRVPPSAELDLIVSGPEEFGLKLVDDFSEALRRLAKVGCARYEPDYRAGRATAKGVAGELNLYLPVEGVVDWERELERIQRELGKLDKELGELEGRLANPSFRTRAPQHVVAKTETEAEDLRDQRRRLLRHVERGT
ncbi:MAG: valine--tRNA ligase [Candidatus Bipolaricaulota bacterium]